MVGNSLTTCPPFAITWFFGGSIVGAAEQERRRSQPRDGSVTGGSV